MTTRDDRPPGGYHGAMEEFYEEAAARLGAHLDAGRDVAVISEGDPFVYSSTAPAQAAGASVPDGGDPRHRRSVSAAACSVLGRPLAEAEEVLTVLPGTLPEDELAAQLAATDSAVILKLGRTFPAVCRALEGGGRLDDAYYVERATMGGERPSRWPRSTRRRCRTSPSP